MRYHISDRVHSKMPWNGTASTQQRSRSDVYRTQAGGRRNPAAAGSPDGRGAAGGAVCAGVRRGRACRKDGPFARHRQVRSGRAAQDGGPRACAEGEPHFRRSHCRAGASGSVCGVRHCGPSRRAERSGRTGEHARGRHAAGKAQIQAAGLFGVEDRDSAGPVRGGAGMDRHGRTGGKLLYAHAVFVPGGRGLPRHGGVHAGTASGGRGEHERPAGKA